MMLLMRRSGTAVARQALQQLAAPSSSARRL